MTFLYQIITAYPRFMKCSFRHDRARVSLRGLSDKRVYFLNLQSAVTEGKSISCYASKLNTETGSPARPTRLVKKLTVKLDAQQLNARRENKKLDNYAVTKIYIY